MKVKRQKRVRKLISFYSTNYGLEAPYSILVDGTFCRAALKFKLNICEQLSKYLEGEVKLSTTPCVIAECEAMGTLLYGPLKILRQYSIAECHHSEPIAASECLRRLAYKERKHKRYIVATQDAELSEKVRSKPGIPLLFISHNTIVFEAPSEKSKQRVARDISEKIQQDHNILTVMKKKVLGPEEKVKRKKRKGPKGPNPLSCKKPKSKAPSKEEGGVSKRKRKRHRRAHISGHLINH